MTTDSPERELFELRPSLLAALVPVDLAGLYSWDVQFALVPWRGLVLGLALLVVGVITLPNVTGRSEILFPALLVLLAAPMGLEVMHRRDVVTESALVRQRGILGHVRTRVPLAEISRVEYSFPRWGRFWDVGDVVILKSDGRVLLRGIRRPAVIAQLILDAKARSLKMSRTG
ncbi:MAG: PH domain-containing protein [Acidobacteria bacterium]|nr:PH domain-containing protein [Acidobacteriota bacterium]